MIFRSDTVSGACTYIGNMFGVKSTGAADALFSEMIENGAFVLIAGILLSLPLYRKLLKRAKRIDARLEDALRSAVCIAVFALSAIEAVSSTYSPFIYFNF